VAEDVGGWPDLSLPPGAQEPWRVLVAALDERGPAPCEYDPERWFSMAGRRVAVHVCRRCPVVEECRAYAVAACEPLGVWGALTFAERRRAGDG
jgi:transcription factor WhiB